MSFNSQTLEEIGNEAPMETEFEKARKEIKEWHSTPHKYPDDDYVEACIDCGELSGVYSYNAGQPMMKCYNCNKIFPAQEIGWMQNEPISMEN